MNRLFILLVVIVFVSGCSKGVETNFVEGTVSLDGAPLAEATVTIVPTSNAGEVASGFSDDNGKFTLTSQSGQGGGGALEGEYLVTVSKVEVTTIPSKTENPDDEKTESKELLPAIYQDMEKSPLRATIQKGKNSIDLKLSNTPS